MKLKKFFKKKPKRKPLVELTAEWELPFEIEVDEKGRITNKEDRELVEAYLKKVHMDTIKEFHKNIQKHNREEKERLKKKKK